MRANAQYDAAAALIAVKDWDGAIKTARGLPHPLPEPSRCSPRSSKKLAVAYLEKGQWANAAGEFERLAAASKDPKVARDALWQAAELYEKANAQAAGGAGPYERYLALNPPSLELSVEARYRHRAQIAKRRRQCGARTDADEGDLRRRPSRRRARAPTAPATSAATAALAMAEPVARRTARSRWSSR